MGSKPVSRNSDDLNSHHHSDRDFSKMTLTDFQIRNQQISTRNEVGVLMMVLDSILVQICHPRQYTHEQGMYKNSENAL